MKKILLVLLVPFTLQANNPEEDFDYGSAMGDHPEAADYKAIAGTLQWRMEEVEAEIAARCDNYECELLTLREHIKGWTFNTTVGNGGGSGRAYDFGSSGSINVINGNTVNDQVVANIGLAYRNITCEKTPLITKSHFRAQSVLMNDIITEEGKIKEDLSPAEIVLLKVYASIINAAGNQGSCGSNGRF